MRAILYQSCKLTSVQRHSSKYERRHALTDPYRTTLASCIKIPTFRLCKASVRRLEVCNAAPKGDSDGIGSQLGSGAGQAVLRIYAPVAVVLGILMLLDAAYSGDWSRIGAITKEQEVQLQGFVPVVISGHSLCAVVAGAISARRGEQGWPLRAAKTLASGVVGVVEVALLPDVVDR